MLMQIDGTFLFVVISFLIFLFIVKSIFFNPITQVIAERENFYAKNSKMESESKEKSKALIEEKETALRQSRKEAQEIIKEASTKAKEESALKIKQAKQETQNLIESNKQELQNQKYQTKTEIKQEVNSIVSSIVSNVLNEQVQVDLKEEKINEYFKV